MPPDPLAKAHFRYRAALIFVWLLRHLFLTHFFILLFLGILDNHGFVSDAVMRGYPLKYVEQKRTEQTKNITIPIGNIDKLVSRVFFREEPGEKKRSVFFYYFAYLRMLKSTLIPQYSCYENYITCFFTERKKSRLRQHHTSTGQTNKSHSNILRLPLNIHGHIEIGSTKTSYVLKNLATFSINFIISPNIN